MITEYYLKRPMENAIFTCKMFKYRVFLCCFFTVCAAKRVHFSACDSDGFTCKNSETNWEKQIITYECPSDANDMLLLINDFNSPPNIETLMIKNCKELTISFQCSRQERNIESMQISDIGTLIIQEDPQYRTQLPYGVILENISYVENIPSFSFSQVDSSSRNVECFQFEKDFRKLDVTNVTIGTIESYGFYMSGYFNNIFLTNVTIDRLRKFAIMAKMNNEYLFQIKDSSIGVVESGAIQVSGTAMSFRNNVFGEISSIGIKGILEKNLFFGYNIVNVLQPHAISIISPNVLIWENTFKNMKSRALEKISPVALSFISEGSFTFKFFSNEIEYMEADCLHPDFETYELVSTDFFIKNNKIYCSCVNSAWLFANTDRNSTSNDRFYRFFLTRSLYNRCSSSCKLPIVDTKRMLEDGKCVDNMTVDWLCQNPIPR